jgi:SAM-dependent methyltransferase
MTQRAVQRLRELFTRVREAGFDDANVTRWFAVPLVTDARWTAPLAGRTRRGLGGWIALWVAGEAIASAVLAPQPTADERAALVTLGLVDDDGVTLRPRARVLPWRGLMIASPPGEQFDISALNVAASLPASASARVWDVGCGAGLLSLQAARAGAVVLASDVDAELVGWTRLNAELHGLEVACAVGDLLAAAPAEARFDIIVFNAPLLRAPLAVADAATRYVSSPRGEALALAFLDGVAVRLRAGGRVLLHAQLTAAVAAALDAWAVRARAVSVVFAHAPDGTPHALTEIDTSAAPARRQLHVPLSPACPHLGRAILDAAAAPGVLDDDATPRPAPWLELRTSERFDGRRRVLDRRFGGVAVDDADVALLERLVGAPLATLGLAPGERERLGDLVGRGLVLL